MFDSSFSRARAFARAAAFGVLTLVPFALSGCGDNGTGASSGGGSSGATVGTIVEHPDPGAVGSLTFTVDANNGGSNASMRIVRIAWGRLVDIRDETGKLQNIYPR